MVNSKAKAPLINIDLGSGIKEIKDRLSPAELEQIEQVLFNEDSNPLAYTYLNIIVHEAVKAKGAITGKTGQSIADKLAGVADSGKADTICNYINGKSSLGIKPTTQPIWLYCCLAVFMLEKFPDLSSNNKRIIASLAQFPLLDYFKDRASRPTEQPIGTPPTRATPIPREIPGSFILPDLDLLRASRQIRERLKFKNVGDQLHYYGYRHSSDAGKIAKFALTLTLMEGGWVKSDAVYRSEQSNKHSVGAAIQVEGRPYIVSYDKNFGIKLMVFSATGPAKTKSGLTFTNVAGNIPVCGRVFLTKTTAIDEDQTGEIEPCQLPAKDRQLILKNIRNEVVFKVTDTILCHKDAFKALLATLKNFQDGATPTRHDYVAITQARLVQDVGRLLADPDFPIFKLRPPGIPEAEETPFNPAAHEHYPFNQILVAKP
jgi:hypothetical protein